MNHLQILKCRFRFGRPEAFLTSQLWGHAGVAGSHTTFKEEATQRNTAEGPAQALPHFLSQQG